MAVEFDHSIARDGEMRSYFNGVDGAQVFQHQVIGTGNMLVTMESIYFTFAFYGQRYRAFQSIRMTYTQVPITQPLPAPAQQEEP